MVHCTNRGSVTWNTLPPRGLPFTQSRPQLAPFIAPQSCSEGFYSPRWSPDGRYIAEGNPPLALRRSIDKGMAPNAAGRHVNYLEIYVADVAPVEMQPVLSYAASLFQH